jgi:hypothetical protein
MELPLFKKAAEVFGAQIYGADDDFNPVPPLANRRPGSADEESETPNPARDTEEM